MAKSVWVLFLLLSSAGCALYLKLASAGWSIPLEHGEVPVTGEPFVWAASLPILLLVGLVNIVWLGVLIFRRSVVGWLIFGLSMVIIVGVVLIDFSHH